MKTKQIIEAYRTLKSAKLTQMSSEDKFKVIKIMHVLRPIATEWDEFIQTIDEKCKGENHDGFIKDAQLWQAEGETTSIPLTRRIEINNYFDKYNKERQRMIEKEQNKEVEVVFDKLSEKAFEKFIESNDFDIEKTMVIYDCIVNN